MDEPGTTRQMSVKGPWGFTINPPVFWISFATVLLFTILTLVTQDNIDQVFSSIRAFISAQMGWFYILLVNLLVIFCAYLAFGPYRHVRLGGRDAKAEFNYWQWFTMLFNAGIGLALMFYSLTEPMTHFASPPPIEGHSDHPSQLAFAISFMHWGIHGWAIYGVLGLAVGFFAYNRKLSLSLRSTLYPLLGNRIYGWIGDTVDILTAIATLFGLATTLGIGIQYISAGLHYLFGLEDSVSVQIILVFSLTTAACISLIRGLRRGIKNLSVVSAWLAVSILVFLFILGPTHFILDSFLQNTGYYLQHFVSLGTWSEVYSSTSWQDGWTLFYWGWWFAWAPFVGIFVARISKGRTVREFVGGVILAPTLATIVWITIYGGAGIYEELFGAGGIVDAVNANIHTAIYVLLERYPISIVSSLAIVLVGLIFFVTSSDSGSFVVDCITSSTSGETPKRQRVFWSFLEGLVASMLLLGGGLVALQTASLTMGLPIAFIMIPMCYALYKELGKE